MMGEHKTTMKKGVFIIPYFGKFHNYFQLFLNSCKRNPNWDWMIFTDDRDAYEYPENVIVYYTDFESIKRKVQSKFDFPICLEKPYKLCDFKPTYGLVFEEYIQGYDFWGHCDCDIIWGNLDTFLTEDILNNYEKIFALGHCTLYKNTNENNQRFKETIDGKSMYREAFSSPKPFAFDEEFFKDNVNRIYRKNHYPLYEKDFSANVNRRASDLRLVRYDPDSRSYIGEREQKGVFIWNQGRIEQYYLENGKLKCTEYLYIHFQNRKMKVELDDLSTPVYKISANNFRNLEVTEITEKNYHDIRWVYRNHQKRKIIMGDIKFWAEKISHKIFSGK